MLKSEEGLDQRPERVPEAILSIKDAQLVCKWIEQKQNADNGLNITLLNGADAIGCVKFEILGGLPKEEGYENLLRAKVFETFGVYNLGVAAAAITNCINSIATYKDFMDMELEKAKAFLEKHCENILSLFQEMRPRDSIELMLVTKMIILDYQSNHEFIGAASTRCDEWTTTRQIRGIKLSRLFLEFKEKLDKHRKPDQQIHVQHNHIYNEGQAIIGSQLFTGGGK